MICSHLAAFSELHKGRLGQFAASCFELLNQKVKLAVTKGTARGGVQKPEQEAATALRRLYFLLKLHYR